MATGEGDWMAAETRNAGAGGRPSSGSGCLRGAANVRRRRGRSRLCWRLAACAERSGETVARAARRLRRLLGRLRSHREAPALRFSCVWAAISRLTARRHGSLLWLRASEAAELVASRSPCVWAALARLTARWHSSRLCLRASEADELAASRYLCTYVAIASLHLESTALCCACGPHRQL